MTNSRREFLKNTGLIGTGILLTGGLDACSPKLPASIAKFGIQLYSLRDDLPLDPKGVLAKVASYGYQQIESYAGKDGIFWGMKHTEFKKYTAGLGLDLVSAHCQWNAPDFEKLAAEAGEIGMKYLMCPYLGAQKTIEDYKQYAAKFNKAGEICKKNGLRFAYHNHDYSFKTLDGQVPQAVMMAETDPNLVDFEMDMYWVVQAGEDVPTWLAKYKNRFRSCHIKDRLKTIDPNDTNNSCTLGEGTINFAKLLKEAAKNGMQYYIVEQERYANTTPLKSAESNAAYMKALQLV
jgi:sugar phosphate isomerase/epimerase